MVFELDLLSRTNQVFESQIEKGDKNCCVLIWRNAENSNLLAFWLTRFTLTFKSERGTEHIEWILKLTDRSSIKILQYFVSKWTMSVEIASWTVQVWFKFEKLICDLT